MRINLKDQIITNENAIDVQKSEMEQLHTDIETLKSTIGAVSKPNWFRSLTSKTLKWLGKSENRQMLGDGYKVVREFLPENVKKALPNPGNK